MTKLPKSSAQKSSQNKYHFRRCNKTCLFCEISTLKGAFSLHLCALEEIMRLVKCLLGNKIPRPSICSCQLATRMIKFLHEAIVLWLVQSELRSIPLANFQSMQNSPVCLAERVSLSSCSSSVYGSIDSPWW